MRSKSRFTTLVLLETRESYLQIRGDVGPVFSGSNYKTASCSNGFSIFVLPVPLIYRPKQNRRGRHRSNNSA